MDKIEEVARYTEDILRELDGMSVEELESMREEYLSLLKRKSPKKCEKVEAYVNQVFHIAIQKAKQVA